MQLAQEEKMNFEAENGDDDQINSKEADDTAASSITHMLGQQDPLADFHKLEVMMINRHDFESWEGKKLKIFARFKL